MTKRRITVILFQILLISLSIGLNLQILAQCPRRTLFSDPRFLIEPPKTVSGWNRRFISISCCVDGYRTLTWEFRKLNFHKWAEKKEINIFLEDDNRTLVFNEPYNSYDDGFYRCTAKDENGKNISRTIYIYFLNTDESKEIKINLPNVSPETRFLRGSNVNLSCSAYTYEPFFPISLSWLRKVDGKKTEIKSIHTISTEITTSKNRSGETNLDLVEVASSMILLDVTVDDTGYYCCQVWQNGLFVERNFVVLVIDNRFNWRLLVIILTTVVTSFCVCILVWYYHYDLIVLYKSYLDPCPKERKRDKDIAIFYEDMDKESLKVSLEILQNLEYIQFRCWLFDRDKTYGANIMDDYVEVMNMTHLFLVVISQNAVRSGNMISIISSIIPDPGVRRLYVFIPNKKTILNLMSIECPDKLKWIKQELRLQSVIHKNSVSIDPEDLHKNQYIRVLTWLVASSPSVVIRQAKERMIEKMKEDVELELQH